MRKLWWAGLILLLWACDSGRVYEKNSDFKNGLWLKDSVRYFQFDISDPDLKYNLYVNVRNNQDYAFYNLYYQYVLSDTLGQTLADNLENINLFDPKTGEPQGDGLGDVFDHRQQILKAFLFPYAGKYNLSLQQYMRQDSLPKIESVGVRVELTGAE